MTPAEYREGGKLALTCCGHTVRDGTGLPEAEARELLEFHLAMHGCTHVTSRRFVQERDAGHLLARYSAEFGESRQALSARLPHWVPRS